MDSANRRLHEENIQLREKLSRCEELRKENRAVDVSEDILYLEVLEQKQALEKELESEKFKHDLDHKLADQWQAKNIELESQSAALGRENQEMREALGIWVKLWNGSELSLTKPEWGKTNIISLNNLIIQSQKLLNQPSAAEKGEKDCDNCGKSSCDCPLKSAGRDGGWTA